MNTWVDETDTVGMWRRQVIVLWRYQVDNRCGSAPHSLHSTLSPPSGLCQPFLLSLGREVIDIDIYRPFVGTSARASWPERVICDIWTQIRCRWYRSQEDAWHFMLMIGGSDKGKEIWIENTTSPPLRHFLGGAISCCFLASPLLLGSRTLIMRYVLCRPYPLSDPPLIFNIFAHPFAVYFIPLWCYSVPLLVCITFPFLLYTRVCLLNSSRCCNSPSFRVFVYVVCTLHFETVPLFGYQYFNLYLIPDLLQLSFL